MTLKDLNIDVKSLILVSKKSSYFDVDEYNYNQQQYDEVELYSKMTQLKECVDPNISEEVIILALKKNRLDLEESMLMLI